MKTSFLVLLVGYIAVVLNIFFPVQLIYFQLGFAICLLFSLLAVTFTSFITFNKMGTAFLKLFYGILLVSSLFFILWLVVNYTELNLYFYPIIYFLLVLIRKPLKKLLSRISKKGKGGTYGKQSLTERGETVRSMSEKIIADWLFSNSYSYFYERTIVISSGEDINKKIKYDFYLPNGDIFIEYWGLDKLKNEVGKKYRERKKEKIELYRKNKLKLISLDEESLEVIDKLLTEHINLFTRDKLTLFQKMRELIFGRKNYPHSSTIVNHQGSVKKVESNGANFEKTSNNGEDQIKEK